MSSNSVQHDDLATFKLHPAFWNIFGPEKPRQLDLQLNLLSILGMSSGQVGGNVCHLDKSGGSSPSARRWFKKLRGLIVLCPQFELVESSHARDGTRLRLCGRECAAELASAGAASEAMEGSAVLRCQGPAG